MLSGTEALVRVMVEGAAEDQVNDLAGRIALAVEEAAAAGESAATGPSAAADAARAGRHGA